MQSLDTGSFEPVFFGTEKKIPSSAIIMQTLSFLRHEEFANKSAMNY